MWSSGSYYKNFSLDLSIKSEMQRKTTKKKKIITKEDHTGIWKLRTNLDHFGVSLCLVRSFYNILWFESRVIHSRKETEIEQMCGKTAVACII